jgi:cellulose synthase/poly-beta-1,6-N-acetylglucosamine synthase-like glycosyltransferase
MLTASATSALVAFSVTVIVYFALWSATQIAMSPIALLFLGRHRVRHRRHVRALAAHLVSPPLVSVIVPSYNEALTIVGSVRALLALDYTPREVIVVNDGSSDDTLAVLQEAFHLVSAAAAFAQPLKTAAVRGMYRSTSDPALIVLDKENGGSKSDAVNAGFNAAAGTLVLSIDADTLLEPDALSRAVIPFLEDASTVAVGGNIAISNGCSVEKGRITSVALPRSWLARFQIIEYMRAFLLFRLACAAGNGVVLISGAFGLFRREAVIAVGGYDRAAIGEDMDLTMRLQRHFRGRREPIRIAFDPYPLGWTQAPEDWRSLRSQRYRWRRGLLQVLWRHREVLGRPRFGVVGLAVIPYILVFEGLGPLLEITGYCVTAGAALLGLLNWQMLGIVTAVSVLFGAAVTMLSVLMSDVATHRYMGGRDLVLLIAIALLESCGYRQLNAWWGCVGTAQALRGPATWGVIKRRAFEDQ